MNVVIDEELSDLAYHADRTALSASGAQLLLPPSCPALFHYEMTHEREPKPHFDFGHVVHKLVLGKGSQVAEAPFEDWKTKKARDWKAAAYAAGQVPILPKDLLLAQDMVKAVREHENASVLLDPELGRTELSIFWDDVETGLRRKCRPDFLPHPQDGLPLQVVDLKTTHSAEPDLLGKIMDDHGLHMQAAWYEAGVVAAGLDEGRGVQFLFVFVEEDPPHLITVADLDQPALEYGWHRNRKALDIWRDCTESGNWPGYSAEPIETLSLRPWRAKQAAYDIENGVYDIREDHLL